MTEPAEQGPTQNWKTRAYDWLFSQGVSTVLLVLILIGCWQALPAAITTVTSSFEKINAENRLLILDLHTKNDAQLRQMAETFQKEREREREQTKEAVGAIRELTNEIRHARQQ